MISFTTLDIAALVWFVAAWSGFGIVVDLTGIGGPPLSRLMDDQRRRWMLEMAQRDVRIVDTAMANTNLGFLLQLSMIPGNAMTFVATISSRWYVHRRGLVSGILTAGNATGQLIFLPLIAHLATHFGWRSAALVVAAAALATVRASVTDWATTPTPVLPESFALSATLARVVLLSTLVATAPPTALSPVAEASTSAVYVIALSAFRCAMACPRWHSGEIGAREPSRRVTVIAPKCRHQTLAPGARRPTPSARAAAGAAGRSPSGGALCAQLHATPPPRVRSVPGPRSGAASGRRSRTSTCATQSS